MSPSLSNNKTFMGKLIQSTLLISKKHFINSSKSIIFYNLQSTLKFLGMFLLTLPYIYNNPGMWEAKYYHLYLQKQRLSLKVNFQQKEEQILYLIILSPMHLPLDQSEGRKKNNKVLFISKLEYPVLTCSSETFSLMTKTAQEEKK